MTVATAQLSTLTNKVIGEVERAVVGKRLLLEKILAIYWQMVQNVFLKK